MATLALVVIVLLAAWINQAKLSGTQETLLAKVSIAKVLTVIYVLMIYEINHIWTAEMKWRWRNDRRSERNLCNCVKKPEKKNSGRQRGLNPWPRDLPVRCSTSWAMKPLTCGFLISRSETPVHLNPYIKFKCKGLSFYTIRKYFFYIFLAKWRYASACTAQPDGG